MTMIDETPAPRPIVRAAHRGDGIAIVTIDDPRAVYNTLGPTLAIELDAVLETLIGDPSVRGILLRSGKQSFLAGAHIGFIRSIRFAKDAEDAARGLSRRFARIENSPKPIVACVHGLALGGGFELALACAGVVASDDARTVFGLPEVKLGLIPHANGMLRIAERSSVRVAMDLAVRGRNLRAADALALGLIDEVVAEEALLDAAAALAVSLAQEPLADRRKARAKSSKALTSGEDVERALLERNPIGRAIMFRRARENARVATRGHYPAAERILDVLDAYGRRGFAHAAALEARLFGELVVSDTSHRLVDLFFARTALKNQKSDFGLAMASDDSTTNLDAALRPERTPVQIERVAVLGAGIMGAGIATSTVQAGLSVRMKDTDDEHLGRGLRYVKGALDGRFARGHLTAVERDRAFQRLEVTIDDTGFRHVDVAIEAVFEDLPLKHAVLRSIEKLVRDDCVIASNTSSLPIAKIAEAAQRPERVVGMHYFRPADRVPLVEVIRTELTSPRALDAAVRLGKRQGKTVIVVRDGAGFFTTRILFPLFAEALRLVSEGATIADIDETLVSWGFAHGPLQLFDELGVELVTRVANVLHDAFGDRMRPPAALTLLAKKIGRAHV